MPSLFGAEPPVSCLLGFPAGNPSKQDTGGSAPNSDGTPYDGTANEEYWGIVDINRNKKITFDVIKNAYVNFDIN